MITIIDYDAGNLASVARAVSHLGYANVVTRNVEEIRSANRIISSGVSAAGSAMNSLKCLGIDAVLRKLLTRRSRCSESVWEPRSSWDTVKKIKPRA